MRKKILSLALALVVSLSLAVPALAVSVTETPTEYGIQSAFFNGLAPVEDENGKWGYIDTTGKLAIPFQYSSASAFS